MFDWVVAGGGGAHLQFNTQRETFTNEFMEKHFKE